jgi:lipopolysaccharide biosynthesis regulator YciM
LFDRAESLLTELAELEPQGRRALTALIAIYQQEKDWSNALATAERLERVSERPLAVEIAHYRCELAEEALRASDREKAAAQLRAAQAEHPQCVRAIMLQARIALDRGDAVGALGWCRQVAEQGPQFIPDMLPLLLEAVGRQEDTDLQSELRSLYRAHPGTALMVALADAIQCRRGPDDALDFLTEHLNDYADLTAMERLLELRTTTPGGGPCPEIVLRGVRRLRERQAAYQCDQCGFVARRLHWQCPSCKHWGTIKAAQPAPMDPSLDKPQAPPGA